MSISPAAAYLTSPDADLWDWSADGEAVRWTDSGATAVLAEHLALLSPLLAGALGGLPPLTSVLLVLDAASDRWEAERAAARLRHLGAMRAGRPTKRPDRALERIGAFLARVHRLPPEERRGVAAQATLLAVAFEEARAWLLEARPPHSEAVAHLLQGATGERREALEEHRAPRRVGDRCERARQMLLHAATRELDADVLRLRRETEWAGLPQPVEVEPPAPRGVRALLESLREDARFAQIAGAALDVAAMLTLPQAIDHPDALPLGGVSDITNRGTPDRLLMSELAQDEQLLLARIATGQALYLRREKPPAPRPRVRPVLLENGIRTWGVGRAAIFAVGLGAAAAEEGRAEVRVFSHAGGRLCDVPLEEQSQLVEHLGRLATDRHPAPVLGAWASRLAEEDVAEPLLVVTEATYADREFREALAGIEGTQLVAVVGEENAVRLFRRTASGDLLLQRVALPDVAGQAAGADVPTPGEGPAYLRMRPAPLRTVWAPSTTWWMAVPWAAERGHMAALGVTRDQRLLFADRARAGAIELDWQLPGGRVVGAWSNGRAARLVVQGAGAAACVAVDRESWSVAHVPLELSANDVRYLALDLRHLYAWRPGELSVLDAATGNVVAQRMLEADLKPVGETFFASASGGYWVAVKTAGGCRVERIGGITARETRPEVVFRDAHGMPVGLRSGRTPLVRFSSGSSPEPMTARFSLAGARAMRLKAVSSDRLRALVEVDAAQGGIRLRSEARIEDIRRTITLGLDLQAGTLQALAATGGTGVFGWLEPEGVGRLQSSSLRTRVGGVALTEEGLVLWKRARDAVRLVAEGGDGRLRLRRVVEHPSGLPLEPVDGLRAGGHRLRKAEFGEREVWVDRRGLIHLRRQGTAREVTLALHESHVSGWVNDGRRFGAAYFLGTSADQPVPADVVQWIDDFCRTSAWSG